MRSDTHDFYIAEPEEIRFLQTALDRPVVLVGMMGTGKTQIGRKLASLLKLEFYDSDHVVEARAGHKISEVFKIFGETKFREAERNVVSMLLSKGACVIATGGGTMTDERTRNAIACAAISLWLKSDVQDILGRLNNPETRPLLNHSDPESVLQKLLQEREAYYSEADIEISNDSGSVKQASGQVIKALCAYLKRDKP